MSDFTLWRLAGLVFLACWLLGTFWMAGCSGQRAPTAPCQEWRVTVNGESERECVR